MINIRPTKMYAVWKEPCEGDTSGSYLFYDSILEAVSDNNEPTEIYEAMLVRLGSYTIQSKAVKEPKPRKETRKKKK